MGLNLREIFGLARPESKNAELPQPSQFVFKDGEGEESTRIVSGDTREILNDEQGKVAVRIADEGTLAWVQVTEQTSNEFNSFVSYQWNPSETDPSKQFTIAIKPEAEEKTVPVVRREEVSVVLFDRKNQVLTFPTGIVVWLGSSAVEPQGDIK